MSVKIKDPQQQHDLELSLSFDNILTCPECTRQAIEWYNNPTLVKVSDFHNPKVCQGTAIYLELIDDISSCSQCQHDEYPEIPGMYLDDIKIKVNKENKRLDNIRTENGYPKIKYFNERLTTKILSDIVINNS